MDSLVLQSKQLCLLEAGGAALGSADGEIGAAPTALSTRSNSIPVSMGTILILWKKMNAPDDI